MKIRISKEVAYSRYVVHPVDENGEVDYEIVDEVFEDSMCDSEGYWRIEGNNYIDSVPDGVPYEQIKAYKNYLEGWFETHDEEDYILFSEYKRSDEYHELFEKN